MKREDNKIKKEKGENLGDNEKEHLRKYEKEERKLSMIALGMMRKNKFEKMIRKERWINVYKL